MENKKIHIIPYTHADYSWTHTRQWHVERAGVILNEVVNLLTENKNLTYAIDCYANLLKPFLEAYPEKAEQLRELIKEGRFEISGPIYSLIRLSQVGGETFIHNVLVGKSEFLKEGIPAALDVYMNVDVAIGHGQIPQLMKLSGYSYYRGWRPQGAMDVDKVPRIFKWQGIDGSEIISSRGSYSGFWDIKYLENFDEDFSNASEQFYKNELEYVINTAESDEVWLSHGMDDTRILHDVDDSEVPVLQFINKWNTVREPKMLFSTPSRFFEAVKNQNLPKYIGEIDFIDVTFNSPAKGEKGLWRKRIELENSILQLEAVCSMCADATGYPEDEISDMWKTQLEICNHATEFTFKNDAEYLLSMAESAIFNAKTQIKAGVDKIISTIKSSEKLIVFVNTDIHEREEYTEVCISCPLGTNGIELVCGDLNIAEYQLIDNSFGDVRYNATSFDEITVLVLQKIPAYGYTSLTVRESENPKGCKNTDIFTEITGNQTETINNGIYDYSFSKGELVEISDGEHVVFDKSRDSGLAKLSFTGVHLNESTQWLSFNNTACRHDFIAESWKFEEFGPLRFKYAVSGKIGTAKAVQEFIIYKNKPEVEIKVKLLVTEEQSGYFTAEFTGGKDPVVTAGIPFGAKTARLSELSYGMKTDVFIYNLEHLWHGVFYGQSYICISDKNRKSAVINGDTSGYYKYDKTTGKIDMILTRTFARKDLKGWTSKLPESISGIGSHTFTFLYLPDADNVQAVAKLSKNKSNPILHGFLQGKAKPVQSNTKHSFVSVDKDNILLSSVSSHAGKQIIRLYESAGKDTKVTVSLDLPVKNAELVDFHGNKLSDITVSENKIHISLSKWQIANILIEK